MSEQQSLAALRNAEIPDSLRDALDGPDRYGDGTIAEAHVAAERWWVLNSEGRIMCGEDGWSVLGGKDRTLWYTGADIFAAIHAALKGE